MSRSVEIEFHAGNIQRFVPKEKTAAVQHQHQHHIHLNINKPTLKDHSQHEFNW